MLDRDKGVVGGLKASSGEHGFVPFRRIYEKAIRNSELMQCG